MARPGQPPRRYPRTARVNEVVLETLAEGGRTELANLWRPCSHHHDLKTYFGWKVVGQNGDRDLVPP